MKEFYKHEDIEHYIQKYWYSNKIFKVKEDCNKKKYYCLSMIPYPSGKLHMGHVRNYTISDVISRYQRMLGKNVLQPIGWDSFGLPAERAAIVNGILPDVWISSNIRIMKNQLKSLGFSYDWDREINTCSSEYYKWEQWFFIRLYKKGLVYKKKSIVNWCSKDETVLANEQVVNNKCWRCNENVKKKNISQWFIKITSYANQLLNDLNKLKQWPNQVLKMQRNWIGKFKGFEVSFNIFNYKETIIIYMKNIDFLINAIFVKISLDHYLILQNTLLSGIIKKYIKKHYNFDFNKVSFNDSCLFLKKHYGIFTGVYAIHPLSKIKLPIFIVDYFLVDFLHGAWIGSSVDNIDDLNFVKKYFFLIKPINFSLSKYFMENINYFVYKGKIISSFDVFNSLHNKEKNKIIINILNILKIGRLKVFYRLRDWCISRQRYWGVPIPIVILENGSMQPVLNKDLPVMLPKYTNLNYKNFKLKNNIDWVKIVYYGKNAIRETDTFDTFMESSWYFHRYTCPNYNKGMLHRPSVNYWFPVDQYIGGIEHSTMHLLYCRFYHKLLRDEGLVNSDEPIYRLLCQGMVLSDTFYYVSQTGERIWVSPLEVNILSKNKNGKIIKAIDFQGNELIYCGMKKMSKSKNNGIDPDIMIKKYGADTIRLFIMFSSPVNMPLEWKEEGVEGMHRFLKKLWNLVYKYIQLDGFISLKTECDYVTLSENNKKLYNDMNKTIIKVTDDIDRRQSFNSAISSIIKLLNEIKNISDITLQNKVLIKKVLLVIIKMLYPFAPHICFFLWKTLGKKRNIDYVSWPIAEKIYEVNKLILVQINGKLRAKVILPNNVSESSVKSYIFKNKILSKFFNRKCLIKKIYFIPNKLINFVVIY
ncbi:MAG: leucine--tRNA ligase [Candidatus Westeberhardia cardiocondylae]|nr:leucine--tRNA ligase [Candidatus Westeberhardia cardiocondylae]